eukprot:6063708-Prymnesium_polylepis.1
MALNICAERGYQPSVSSVAVAFPFFSRGGEVPTCLLRRSARASLFRLFALAGVESEAERACSRGGSRPACLCASSR